MRILRFAYLLMAVAVVACNNDTPTKPTKSPSPKVSKAPGGSPTPEATPTDGGATPTPTPTATGGTPKPTPTPTPNTSGTATPTPKPTGTATATPTPTPTPTATPTPKAVNVTTVAGTGTSTHTDGPGASATFNQPTAVVAYGGDLYVADAANNCIRKIDSTGMVSTYAGDAAGNMGFVDADNPLDARFNFPTGLAVDQDGNLYVADSSNNRIRMIVGGGGKVSTLAGGAAPGAANADGTAASFSNPTGLALESTNLYVADKDNHAIRKIDLATAAHPVTTYAGGSGAGLVSGAAADAKFFFPSALAADGKILYVIDTLNHRVRKIDAAGVVSTLAGQPDTSGASSPKGFVDGAVETAKFDFTPGGGLAVGPDKTVTAADPNHDRIRAIANGKVTTLAGAVDAATGRGGFGDGPGTTAKFTNPVGLAVLADGTIYVADQGNNRIRKIK
jgi:sugar lactone lactonase YvrE